MKNEKQTSNLNFNVQLFWKSENHLFWCFLSQLQYRKEIMKFLISYFNLSKTTKWCFGYTDWQGFAEGFLRKVLKVWFKQSVKKQCVAKVLLKIWEIFLHENNRNCNSYRFNYKFAYKQKTRISFSASWW